MTTNESDCPGAAPFSARLECIRPPTNGSTPPPPTNEELENSSNRQLLRMIVLSVHGVRATTESTHAAVTKLGESQQALESRVGLLEKDSGAMYVGITALMIAVIALIWQVLT